MRGVVDGDAAGAHALLPAPGEEGVESFGVSGHDHGGGAVDGGDGDAGQVGDEGVGLLVGDGNGHHAAVPGQFAGDGEAADGDDRGGVGEGQGTADGGRGDLALGVAEDGGRFEAVGAPQLGEGDHHGPQGGLGDVDPVEGGGAVGPAQYLGERPVDVRGEGGLAVRYRPGEDR